MDYISSMTALKYVADFRNYVESKKKMEYEMRCGAKKNVLILETPGEMPDNIPRLVKPRKGFQRMIGWKKDYLQNNENWCDFLIRTGNGITVDDGERIKLINGIITMDFFIKKRGVENPIGKERILYHEGLTDSHGNPEKGYPRLEADGIEVTEIQTMAEYVHTHDNRRFRFPEGEIYTSFDRPEMRFVLKESV